MTIQNETIWLTGASSGIGLQLAKVLASQGNTVIVSARNETKLLELEKQFPENIIALPFDVSNKDSVGQTKEKLESVTTTLDRVILNAGTCEYFDVEQPDWDLFTRVNDTNYLGMVNSIEVCFDLLKKTANSHLIGIASQAIFSPFPRAEAYGASKAAVTYLLDSLRIDLKPLGIDVSTIHPGFVDTPLTQKNDFNMPFLVTPEKAISRILKAIEARHASYSFPKRLRLALAIHKLKTTLFS